MKEKKDNSSLRMDANNCMSEEKKQFTPKLWTWQRALSVGTFAAIAILAFVSCTRKAMFQTSTVVPAARGYVKVKKDNNNNYNIYVTLEDLAEPERLTPSKHAYTVWLVAEDNSTKNIGQIKTSTRLFSSKLRGSFETVSITKPVKIFITAEDDAATQFPGMVMVLTTTNF